MILYKKIDSLKSELSPDSLKKLKLIRDMEKKLKILNGFLDEGLDLFVLISELKDSL